MGISFISREFLLWMMGIISVQEAHMLLLRAVLWKGGKSIQPDSGK